MARQLTFDLPRREARGRDDFFVSPANEQAVALMDGNWPQARLLLVGPEGAGKSHLTQVWASDRAATILHARELVNTLPQLLAQAPAPTAVEDIDQLAGKAPSEETLFHLLNAQAQHGQPLLLTASAPPQRAGFLLPDLLSRLTGLQMARLDAPDDALLAAVLVKLFRDRQIDIAPQVVNYILTRSERSFAALGQIVAALDAEALTRGSAITRPLAAEIFSRLPAQVDIKLSDNPDRTAE